jgi:opacity protein-like surface antigen
MRLYLLESNYIKFFVNAGIGLGAMSGDITESTANVKFSGSNTGFQGGLGVEFCFSKNHCVNLEANYRVLDFPRNIASSASGTFTSTGGRITQAGNGQEVEINGSDLKTSLTGITGNLGYAFYF